MNHKKLLAKYREGELTEEEKRYIEDELEKYEAIEEYYASQLDDELFSLDDQNEDLTLETKKIKRRVNARLRNIIIASVLSVLVLYVAIFYGVSGIYKHNYYNPTKVTQTSEHGYQDTDFYYDMKAYISLNMPGYAIGSFTHEQDKGFSEYDLSYPLTNLFSERQYRYNTSIKNGRLTYGIDGIFGNEARFDVWNGFEAIKYPGDSEDKEQKEFDERLNSRNNDITLNYINEINPLSYVSMSITLSDDMTMEALNEFINQYEGLKVKWVSIRTLEDHEVWSENQPQHLIGFNPNYNDEPSSSRSPDKERYPLFNLEVFDVFDEPEFRNLEYPAQMGLAYTKHFTSRLKYLSEQEDFIRIFDYNDYKIPFYHQALNYIEENGVKANAILVYGKAEDFKKYLDEIPYNTIYINEVLPTKPNIYYD